MYFCINEAIATRLLLGDEMSIDYAAIGRRIQGMRKKSKRTQENLAEYLSVSVGYISQIERGVTKINLDTLSEIARWLECDIAALVSGITPQQETYLKDEIGQIYAGMSEQQRKILLEIALAIQKYG